MWLFEQTVAHLAQVQQPFQAIIKRDERTEINHIRHCAFNLLALVVTIHGV